MPFVAGGLVGGGLASAVASSSLALPSPLVKNYSAKSLAEFTRVGESIFRKSVLVAKVFGVVVDARVGSRTAIGVILCHFFELQLDAVNQQGLHGESVFVRRERLRLHTHLLRFGLADKALVVLDKIFRGTADVFEESALVLL